MNELERRIKELWTRITAWWSSSAKDQASERGKKAASRAASTLHDLREHETAKKAEAKLNDLRGTDAAKRAESALADLRQREPVKKAEESARKVMHDLFSGGTGSHDSTGSTGSTPAS